ncbi:MAG: tRNA uridine(34) 5-carboxymethylaminomethyl modification radical SAM/GNAT enzyme Elp3, partial [Anaerolineaceae bacterium]|nr:tRNA uridine(34) 5-carboxymethylaminomethyl modification radical SAM/GNAT enzyme Elp3 [Anaerolineaceae bacterium]
PLLPFNLFLIGLFIMDADTWRLAREHTPEKLAAARVVLEEIRGGREVWQAMRRHPLPEGGYLPKHMLVAAYHGLVETGEWAEDADLLRRIRMKPVRTLSGVTTVTVLTKPYPCPGKCIFCPTDARMPKSYLPDEPGARRGLEHHFDPYDQVRSRLEALESVGHPTDKIELLILGGTWSSYRRDYQEWFVRRCFDALNNPAGFEDFHHVGATHASPLPGEDRATHASPLPGEDRATHASPLPGEDRATHASPLPGEDEITPTEWSPDPGQGDALFLPAETIEQAHSLNEISLHRNVGLVIETRPDEIDVPELAWLRKLGVTKIQMGAQSLDDRILNLNQRGHTALDTLRATALLRAAGFKIVLHWMPNLLGATPDSDRDDFARLWAPASLGWGYCPDELKIYPTQLLANADLFAYWQRGEYHPYTQEELVELIAEIKPSIGTYCRVNRIIRDIPSTNVVSGNKRTSLRQDVQAELARRGAQCGCIRCHEIRGEPVDAASLTLEDHVYFPAWAEEHFLHFRTPQGQIAGYLRLSLPGRFSPQPGALIPENLPAIDLPDLHGAALIREVHVYGQSLPVGAEQAGAAQHVGLGTRLLSRAEDIAREHGFTRLAVIAAVGTRRYYLDRGFKRGALYLVKPLAAG